MTEKFEVRIEMAPNKKSPFDLLVRLKLFLDKYLEDKDIEWYTLGLTNVSEEPTVEVQILHASEDLEEDKE